MTGPLAPGAASDTIFALASGTGRSAISVIRLSGSTVGDILQALCGPLPPARCATLRRVRDAVGDALDHALILWMPAPRSYTGEDCAELHLHGGRALLVAVSDALLALGARPADPGEFSRRAYLAGKMDLLEAEGVADLTQAETQAQRVQALRQMQGAQSRKVADWADRLKRGLAFQEALIDFPDETLPDTLEPGIIADLRSLLDDLALHIQESVKGQRLRQGLVFAITGPPNAGKSSLINVLAGREVAIVSAIPGTTRDPIEAHLELAGAAVSLVDTAGLRESSDPVEAEGVLRARARADESDLVLHVIDSTEGDSAPVLPGCMLIANKIDLAAPPPGYFGISLKTGSGVAELQAALSGHAQRLTHAASPVLTRARHSAALRDAGRALEAALAAPLPELRAEDLRQALQAIGRLTGTTETEDLLDIVFGAFCIGK